MKILIGTNTFGKYKRQDIAVDSYKHLKKVFPDVVDVLDVQFRDEESTSKNHYKLDIIFDLTRSSHDYIEDGEKKLPFVNDILRTLYEQSEDYFIFVNSDVIINPNLIEYIIENEPQCFPCSRLDIRDIDSFDKLKEQAQPVRWEIAGFDCFVFKREWYKEYYDLFNDYLLSRPRFDPVYAGIMKCFGDNTPIGNQYPPFCFHIHHANQWNNDSKETQFNINAIENDDLDIFIDNMMFFNLKHNLTKREPWGAFLKPQPNEQLQEKIYFDNFNVHIPNEIR